MCGSVSGEHYSLTWSDWTSCIPTASASAAAPQLRPFQQLLLECVCPLSHTHSTKYNKPRHTVEISSLCMLLHILVSWVGVLSSNKGPFAMTCSENGGWAYFWVWAYFWETTVVTCSLASFTGSMCSWWQLILVLIQTEWYETVIVWKL